MNLKAKEQIEIDYWKNSKHESPEDFTAGNFVNKTKECRNLIYRVRKNMKYFRNKKNVLEIGAGQGWASCFIKRFILPEAKFTVTDISPAAVEGLHYWESIFDVKIENAYAAKSYAIKAPDKPYDLIFCYAAAHHFILHKETLENLSKWLSPKGSIVYIYEPTSSKLLYPLHYYYVNKAAHSTPEDVIVPSQMKKIANEFGLKCIIRYDAHQRIIRSVSSSLYFGLLRVLPFLHKLLPSSADLIFEKVKPKA